MSVGLTALVVAAFVSSLLMLPSPEPVGPPDVAQLAAELAARERTDLFSARPAYLPEPPEPFGRASPPAPLSAPALVSKSVLWGERRIPYLVPDLALPLRYRVGARLARRFGLAEVAAAMRQWDGIPGSRWATELVDVTAASSPRARAGGTSLVYLRDSCPQRHLAGALWNTRPGTAHIDARYGTGVLYSAQIDIGVCPGVLSVERMRAVLAHEVGHMMGMAHLCEPGEICWTPEMARGDRRCRVMYYRFGPCRAGVTAVEHDAARHLYPTLPRLHGPTVAETAARASYATTRTHTATHVVLAPTDSPYAASVAAALAGTLEAPLLLGRPHEEACVAGAAARELARAARNPGTAVLVGAWPDGCASALEPWDVTVERLGGDAVAGDVPDPERLPRLSVTAADATVTARREHGEEVTSALLAVADGSPASALDAAVAAAAAGRRRVPLLLSGSGRLSGAVAQWLAAHPHVLRVRVVAAPEAAHGLVPALADLGVLATTVDGADPTGRALRLAERTGPAAGAGGDDEPVVLADRTSTDTAVVGAGVAARIGAPLLLGSGAVDARVLAWLRHRAPAGGYLVAGPAAVPYPVQWAYTEVVRPRPSPARATVDTPRLRLGQLPHGRPPGTVE